MGMRRILVQWQPEGAVTTEVARNQFKDIATAFNIFLIGDVGGCPEHWVGIFLVADDRADKVKDFIDYLPFFGTMDLHV